MVMVVVVAVDRTRVPRVRRLEFTETMHRSLLLLGRIYSRKATTKFMYCYKRQVAFIVFFSPINTESGAATLRAQHPSLPDATVNAYDFPLSRNSGPEWAHWVTTCYLTVTRWELCIPRVNIGTEVSRAIDTQSNSGN